MLAQVVEVASAEDEPLLQAASFFALFCRWLFLSPASSLSSFMPLSTLLYGKVAHSLALAETIVRLSLVSAARVRMPRFLRSFDLQQQQQQLPLQRTAPLQRLSGKKKSLSSIEGTSSLGRLRGNEEA